MQTAVMFRWQSLVTSRPEVVEVAVPGIAIDEDWNRSAVRHEL